MGMCRVFGYEVLHTNQSSFVTDLLGLERAVKTMLTLMRLQLSWRPDLIELYSTQDNVSRGLRPQIVPMVPKIKHVKLLNILHFSNICKNVGKCPQYFLNIYKMDEENTKT